MLMSTAVSVFRHADRVSVRGANTAGNTRRPDVLRRPKSRDEWVPRRSIVEIYRSCACAV